MPTLLERITTATGILETNVTNLLTALATAAGYRDDAEGFADAAAASAEIANGQQTGDVIKASGSLVATIAPGVVTLAKLANDVIAVIQGGLDPTKYQGLWNASTNTPTIAAAAGGNSGFWYFVSTAGTATGNAAGTYIYGDAIVSNGTAWLKRPAPPTVIAPGSVDYAKLGSDVTTLIDKWDTASLSYAIVDSLKRIAFGVKTDGKLVGDIFSIGVGNGLSLSFDSSGRASLSLGSTEGVLPLGSIGSIDSRELGYEDSEYAFAVTDSGKRIAFGVKKTGEVVLNLELTEDNLPEISSDKLPESKRYDNAACRENSTYIIFPKKSGSYWHLLCIKKATGQVFTLTSGSSNNFDPFLTSDNKVLFFSDRDPTNYLQYFVGAEGGTVYPTFPSSNISCYGDSLTAGAGGTAYPTQLDGLLPGRTIYNGGVGGEGSLAIKNRFVADVVRDKWTVVLWLGRNDGRDTASIAATKANIAACVAHLKCYTNRFLIMSILNGDYGAGEAVGGSSYIAMRDVYNYCVTNWPNNVFDIQTYLVDLGLAAAGITPTSTDIANVANRVVPASLRADAIHLNTAGYSLVAARVANFFTTKGW